MRSQLLRPEDDDVREAFQKAFSEQVTLRIKCDFQEVNYDKGLFSVRYLDAEEKEQIATGDALLVATGIKPWTDSLNLGATEIKCNEKGFVVVPVRWVVERTLAWLGRYRRLSKDYEHCTTSSEGMIYVASIKTMLKRLVPITRS